MVLSFLGVCEKAAIVVKVKKQHREPINSPFFFSMNIIGLVGFVIIN